MRVRVNIIEYLENKLRLIVSQEKSQITKTYKEIVKEINQCSQEWINYYEKISANTFKGNKCFNFEGD